MEGRWLWRWGLNFGVTSCVCSTLMSVPYHFVLTPCHDGAWYVQCAGRSAARDNKEGSLPKLRVIRKVPWPQLCILCLVQVALLLESWGHDVAMVLIMDTPHPTQVGSVRASCSVKCVEYTCYALC